jgi:hypothetical protein
MVGAGCGMQRAGQQKQSSDGKYVSMKTHFNLPFGAGFALWAARLRLGQRRSARPFDAFDPG